jgi:Tfp pilus assembly protein PilF
LYFIPSQEKKTTLLPALALAGMIAVISVLYLYLRSLAVQKVLSTAFGLIPMITNLRTLPEFIAKFFLPFFLAPMAGFTIFNTLAGLILIGLLIWLIVRASRPEWIALLAGLFWFLLLALPGVMYSHTLGSAAYDYLEQRAYFPSMGLILVLFFLIESPSNLKIRTKLMVAISSVTVVFSVYAHFYAKNYENPMTFYDHAIRSNPQSAVACLNRGLLRSEFKDFEGAMKDNVKALEVFPHYAQAWVNKGILLDHFNKDDEAVAAYDSALKYKPDLFQAHYNKANMVLRRGKYDLAIKEYDISIRLNPDYLPAYSARAMVNNQTKNYTAAINDLTHVIDNDPKAGTAYLNRGRIWFNLNKRENACSDWKNALNLGESEAKSLIQTYCKE